MELTLGSLFDGLGGWQIAAVRAGVKPIFSSEIEKFPLALTKVRFPNTKQLGDVTKIDGTKIEAPDILTAGSPCFVAGTLVHTEDGLKPIELVCEDWDFVLAEDGKYHRVTETMCRESNDIYELKAQGMLTTEVTENHPLLVRHMKRYYPQLENGKRGNFRRFSNPEWVQVKDLKKTDFVAFPIIKEERNTENITEEEAWLIGRYIADGYINNRQRSGRPQGQVNHKVIFCIGKRKLEDFKKKVTTYHVCPKEDRTAYKCEIISERLVKLCLACGCGAINKEIPYKYLALPKSILKALITGYLDGDGCYHTLKKSYSATTISRKLALSLQLGIHKVLHIPCKLYFNKRPPTCVIEGRTVNQHDTYMLSWKTYIPKQSRAIVDENYVWQPIRSVIKVEKTAKVYNLEVDQVHSYCANGIVVHNCQNLSVAGNREGLKGEQSGLFRDSIRLIRQLRMSTGGGQPRFFVWENVPGAFTSGSERGADFRAVLESIAETDIPMPKDGRWAAAGMVQCPKCEIAWRTLDAQFWGVPQRRKRIFLVADFAATDRRAGKILFVEPSLSGNTEQSRETRKRVASTIEKSIRTASELVHRGGTSVVKIRSGRDDGTAGKGALIGIEQSFTLGTGNDQTLFQEQQFVDVYNGTMSVDKSVALTAASGNVNTSGPKVLEQKGYDAPLVADMSTVGGKTRGRFTI